MPGKESLFLIKTLLDRDKNYIHACILEDIDVICLNKETGKSKSMSFKLMHYNNSSFWVQNKIWEYYISHDDLIAAEKRLSELSEPSERPVKPEKNTAQTDAPKKEHNTIHESLGKKYDSIAAMSEVDRVKHINDKKTKLEALVTQMPKGKDKKVIAQVLVESTHDTVLYNYATLMDTINLSNEDAKNKTQEMVEATYALIKPSSQLISENIFNDELINTLVSKSNGTIIQHMTRVYMKGIAFLSWYNNLVLNSSINDKLRIAFKEKYLFFYHSLLPHDTITLEKVFMGGMRAIPEETFSDWAVGFLLHDIGKAAAVEYHEGESAYNRDIVTEHIKIGYQSIMTKTNYPRSAGLIAGYHHEYYGDSSGYGLLRQTIELFKKTHPHAKPYYCITYDIEPLLNYEALAFFPAKFLEVVDVYDAFTDPNRKYRKALSPMEALAAIRKEFIEMHQKIDIILFDLFSKYIQESQAV